MFNNHLTQKEKERENEDREKVSKRETIKRNGNLFVK